MKNETFTYNRQGKETLFSVGQKVECIHYHEEWWPQRGVYNRNWLKAIIDRPFKPVKLGVIVGDAGTHPYWLPYYDGKVQYLLVKFKEYFFAKPIPISCIYDVNESIKKMEKSLQENEDKRGSDSFGVLSKQLTLAKSFAA